MNDANLRPSAWSKFREQAPAVLITVALVIAAIAVINERSARREEASLAPLREQNEALRAQADENQRQIEATAQLLRTAVGNHEGELFKTDVEIQRLNDQRINALASAIAQKVGGILPAQKSPDELARLEDEEVEKISARTAEKLQPSLADIGRREQGLAEAATATAASDGRVQRLDANLKATEAAARDALQYSEQLSALYLNTFDDHGTLVRILSLPANVVRDTVSGNLITGRDRKQAQQQIDEKLRAIEQRLQQIEAQGTGAPMALAN